LGVALAGIAFRVQTASFDVTQIVAALTGEELSEIEQPNQREFDIRNHSDVMVQVFDEICFIYNNDIVWDILENPKNDAVDLYRGFGLTEVVHGVLSL